MNKSKFRVRLRSQPMTLVRTIIIFAAVGVTPARADDLAPLTEDEVLSPGDFVDEVMSKSAGPHVFDWRTATVEIESGVDYVDEANNFDTDGWHLGAAIPFQGGAMARFLMRRYYVHATDAGKMLARTPFRQTAQPTRYEFALGGGYTLFEGRGMTRFLSPKISDSQHALFGLASVHYTDPNVGPIPKRGDDTGVLPGQHKAYSDIVIELGLRWELYFPSALGVFFEMNKEWPRTSLGGGLTSWQHFSTGLAWAIGAK